MTKCMITGIVLFLPGNEECFHADLFVQGDTCIFNANQHNDIEHYRDIVAISKTQRTGLKFAVLLGSNHDTYFERRGVFVVPSGHVRFSVEALEYMEAAP